MMNRPGSHASSGKLQSVVQFLSNDVAALKESLADLGREIPHDALPVKGDAFHLRTLEAFEQSQAACRDFERLHQGDSSVVKDMQKLFLEETNPTFSQSWIGHRARTKPNGFVGDYEMLIKLYDEITPARGLGAYIDLCIQDLPLARAVRTRLKGARQFLLEEIESRTGKVRILDVASGPCREYHNWPHFEDREIEIVAMDTDPQALAHVTQNVSPTVNGGTTLRPVRYNALRTTVAEATVRQFGKFDVIYSVGLCDYLTDDQLIRMFAAWRDTLSDSGVMYVAFKDCEQYDHTPYQWHLDWYFYQRTHEEALKLFSQAGIDVDAMTTTKDETGIITNYIFRKSDAKHVRVDSAEAIAPSFVGTPIAAPLAAEK
jgi:extracellular factor (EF) 3-hydroxypalmitic acid methyl ester biosynthesis protein